MEAHGGGEEEWWRGMASSHCGARGDGGGVLEAAPERPNGGEVARPRRKRERAFLRLRPCSVEVKSNGVGGRREEDPRAVMIFPPDDKVQMSRLTAGWSNGQVMSSPLLSSF